jgi:two-component system, NarL family, response regulator DegU
MLADDHRILREGLARALTGHGVDVIGQACDGDEAIQLAEELSPDVILMDVTMPHVDGLEATRQIHKLRPDIKIVMLTMHADHDVFTTAIRNGAVGYLVKDCSTEEIVDAVTLAASGAPLSPQLASSMLDEVRRLGETPDPTAPDELVVSPKEEQVLQLIVDGCSTAEIGERLSMSSKTVKDHLSAIYTKLEARDRTEAIMRAVRLGIVNLD